MRIDKVEIDGFGKLHNVSYSFADGVNLVYGENESGKSTLCEFIVCAFYGLPNESKKSSEEIPLRRKYRPWCTESFGGRVYFTDDNGKEMVIERSFKGTKRGDKTAIRDAKTWEETDNCDAPGEQLFGISREAFLKTLYIKSFGADLLRSDDGEIMSRLSNLETSGDEDISYAKIINGMEKEIYSLKTKTGRGGKISVLEDKIRELESELSMSGMTFSALESEAKEVENLKKAAAERENDAKLLEEKYNIALKYEKYQQSAKIKESKSVLEKRIDASSERLAEIDNQIKKLDEDKDISVTAETISNVRALETKRLIAEERLSTAKTAQQKSIKSHAVTALLVIFVVGVLMLVSGMVIDNGVLLIVGLGALVGGAVTAVGFLAEKRKKAEKKAQEQKDAENELNAIESELNKLLSPYGVSVSDELSALFMSLKTKEEKRDELIKQYNDLKTEIEGLQKSIPCENEESFADEVINYSGESAEVLFAKINVLKAESRQMQERSAEISVRLARKTAEIRSEADIQAELAGVHNEYKEVEKRYNSLVRAAEWLGAAHEEIKNNFAPKLNQKTSELLSAMTNGKYSDIRANDSFGINLKPAGGEIVEAGYMSRGTYDLLYIALRFAALSVLTDGKIPPVILDDAFSQLDDTRLLAATDMISENSEFKQVLLFTCHKNYKELLADKNINVVLL